MPIGVGNIPPKFGGADIGVDNGTHRIAVTASDFNSYYDIKKITVDIIDINGGTIATFQ